MVLAAAEFRCYRSDDGRKSKAEKHNKRGWKTALILIALLLVAGLVYCLIPKAEPTYQGKIIDAWIDEWAARQKTRYYDAIQAIGTNALPYVARNLARNDSWWHQKYAAFEPKTPKSLQKFLPAPKPLLQAVDGANAFFYCGSNSIPIAIALLKHKSPTVRESAAWGLSALRRKTVAADQAIPALIEALNDKARMVRFDATLALEEMGPDASNAVPALTKVLADSGKPGDPRIAGVAYLQAVAANALGKIGPAAATAVPQLKATLSATNSYLRGQAAAAIWRIDGDVDTVLPILLKEISGTGGDLNWDWIVALGEMGPRAKAAVPQLKKELVKASQPWVLQHITNALMRIDPTVLPNGGNATVHGGGK